MAQQTAVDWFWNEVGGKTLGRDSEFFAQKLQQAKQMEKEQIKNAVDYGCSDWGSCKDFEQYYNENYAKQG